MHFQGVVMKMLCIDGVSDLLLTSDIALLHATMGEVTGKGKLAAHRDAKGSFGEWTKLMLHQGVGVPRTDGKLAHRIG